MLIVRSPPARGNDCLGLSLFATEAQVGSTDLPASLDQASEIEDLKRMMMEIMGHCPKRWAALVTRGGSRSGLRGFSASDACFRSRLRISNASLSQNRVAWGLR